MKYITRLAMLGMLILLCLGCASQSMAEQQVCSAAEHDYSVFQHDEYRTWFQCSSCGSINEDSYETYYKKTTSIGKLLKRQVSCTGVTAVVSDETVIRIESMTENAESGTTEYTVRGLLPGTATVSFVTPDGKTVNQHLYTVGKRAAHIGKGGLLSDISVDKYFATVYQDSTLITYTITTKASVDRLEFTQITDTDQSDTFDALIKAEKRTDREVILEFNHVVIDKNQLSDVFVHDETHGIKYAASRAVDGDTATWTVQLDFGNTAVAFVRIKAYDDDANASQANYVKLSIVYPVFDNTDEDFAKLVNLLVQTNATTPIMFKSASGDLDDFVYYYQQQHLLFITYGLDYHDRFTNTILFGGTSVTSIPPYGIVTPCTTQNFIGNYFPTELFCGKRVLCDKPSKNGNTLAFYHPLSDELRAIVAYQNGYEIDGEKFPYAKSIYDKMIPLIGELIHDGMTDFEKERAIYTWLYEFGVNASINGYAPIPDGVDTDKVTDTAFGILNNYGGMCMGYSATFKLLCNLAGLECATVDLVTTQTGGADENLPDADHQANIIKLDDEYYFVESFWSSQKVNPSDGTYRYFNMTSEEAAEHYSWATEDKGGPFVCDGTTYRVDIYTGELLTAQP